MSKIKRGDTVTLWGIEGWPHSPSYGKLVCPRINLWNTIERTRIKGKLKHDTRVMVKRVEKGDDGRTYYQIEKRTGMSTKRGWVSSWFIKEHEGFEVPK